MRYFANYSRARQATWQYGACSLHTGYLRLQTHASRICNTCWFSTAKWLHKYVAMSRYMYIACLVDISVWPIFTFWWTEFLLGMQNDDIWAQCWVLGRAKVTWSKIWRTGFAVGWLKFGGLRTLLYSWSQCDKVHCRGSDPNWFSIFLAFSITWHPSNASEHWHKRNLIFAGYSDWDDVTSADDILPLHSPLQHIYISACFSCFHR